MINSASFGYNSKHSILNFFQILTFKHFAAQYQTNFKNLLHQAARYSLAVKGVCLKNVLKEALGLSRGSEKLY